MAEPMVGFIGASYSSAVGRDGSTLNGGRYLTLPDALRRISDYWTVSTAWAGASGNDYWQQANALVAQTTHNGQSTLDIIVIDLVGQCSLHKCSIEEQDRLIETVKEIAALADANDIKVIVNGYPDADVGFWQWRERYLNAMKAVSYINYARIYDGIKVVDGTHPDRESMLIAAVRLKEIILRLEKSKGA